ncbi:MAG: hypothetical protein PHV34_24595 [Verrucomicrobiae bacterium]|nr:hypothetical protein [Verrucomicrobiae bacterium]
MKGLLVFVVVLWAVVTLSFVQSVKADKANGKAPVPVEFASNGCSSSGGGTSSGGE